MTERAIKKMKNRFILLAMASFIVVMIFVGILIFLVNLAVSRREISMVLDYIIENDGDLPVAISTVIESDEGDDGKPAMENIFRISRGYESPEFLFDTRYFAVIFNGDDSVRDVKTGYIAAVNEEEAVDYAREVKSRTAKFGKHGNYYYKIRKRADKSVIVVFLESANEIRVNDRLLYFAMYMVALGMIISFVLVNLLAGRVVKNEVRNAELQKQFLTNISHELKTPLAVIRANTEILEMKNGESEWSASIMKQIERMDGLIKNLVTITRAQEQDGKEGKKTVDLTAVVNETVENFSAIASQEEKKFTSEIAPGVKIKAHEGQMRQLAALLVDNAIKYCDDGGEVKVTLSRKAIGARLVVANTFKDGENLDCERFFDRFYRADESHNVEQGGYGVGLSIAESIVRRQKGSINAAWNSGTVTFTCIL